MKRVTEGEFITALKEDTGYYMNSIKDILNGMRNVLPQLLSDVADEGEVDVCICPGLHIIGRYGPAKTMADPRDHSKTIQVDERCLVTIRQTNTFKDSMAQEFANKMKIKKIREELYADENE